MRQDQEQEVEKDKCLLQSPCFMPGVLHRLSYLFHQKLIDEKTEVPLCEVII